MRTFEQVNSQVKTYADAGKFSPSLAAKIANNSYELREAELVVKAQVAGQTGIVKLLKSGNKINGVVDYDGGTKLNQNYAFISTHLEIAYGLAGDGVSDPAAAVFGGVVDDAFNEAKMIIETDGDVITDRAVRSITKGISSDDHKLSMPGVSLNKLLVLKDGAEQQITFEIPAGLTAQSGAGKNLFIAVIHHGFAVIG